MDYRSFVWLSVWHAMHSSPELQFGFREFFCALTCDFGRFYRRAEIVVVSNNVRIALIEPCTPPTFVVTRKSNRRTVIILPKETERVVIVS